MTMGEVKALGEHGTNQYTSGVDNVNSSLSGVFWALELERVSGHQRQGLFDTYGRRQQTGGFLAPRAVAVKARAGAIQ
jgi:hypothetical protein